eukprot:scaffold7377_cov389-Prasinococcus_capsulatus_cf.AAC.17
MPSRLVRVQGQLEDAQSQLAAAEERVSNTKRSVTMLAGEANKIEAMIKGIIAENMSTKVDSMAPTDIAESSSYADPLERKFRDLEGK